MTTPLHMESPDELYMRVYSFYRHSYPVDSANKLSLFITGGFEKRYGNGVLACVHCGFTTDCRLPYADVERVHYTDSPDCVILRLDDSPINELLRQLKNALSAGHSTCQLLFEDDYVRVCSEDHDFRLLTFAYGQWGFKSQLPAALLAKHGFYYGAKRQISRCVACLLPIDNTIRADIFATWHQATSPQCRFVQASLAEAWQPLQFEHDVTGHFKQLDADIEIVEQRCAPRVRPAHLVQGQGSPPRPISLEPSTSSGRMRRRSNEPTTLGQLCHNVNARGVSDAEMRVAIKQDTALLDCPTAADFVQQLQQNQHRQPSTSVETETDLRVGNMATIIDANCELCLSHPKNSAILPCGHVFACLTCNQRLFSSATDMERRCSVCRGPIHSVLPLILTHAVTHY